MSNYIVGFYLKYLFDGSLTFTKKKRNWLEDGSQPQQLQGLPVETCRSPLKHLGDRDIFVAEICHVRHSIHAMTSFQTLIFQDFARMFGISTAFQKEFPCRDRLCPENLYRSDGKSRAK